MLKRLAEKLLSAHSVVLSTHRHCDGDGLGAQLALLHGLRKLGKHARILNVDRPIRKYHFLGIDTLTEVYQPNQTKLGKVEIALILDTNDRRLVEPLYSSLEKNGAEIYFVDHHPLRSSGPTPTPGSIIDTDAASTGELAYHLLQTMKITLDATIARALYTSLAFDTHLFRYVKADPRSHLMAADLLKYERFPEEVHKALFATHSVEKVAFIASALTQIEYVSENKGALIYLRADDFVKNGLELDESGDVIDMIMNIQSIMAAGLIREDAPGQFKISLRSKSPVEVLSLAENLGGGGHRSSSGAYVSGDLAQLRKTISSELSILVGAIHAPAGGHP